MQSSVIARTLPSYSTGNKKTKKTKQNGQVDKAELSLGETLRNVEKLRQQQICSQKLSFNVARLQNIQIHRSRTPLDILYHPTYPKIIQIKSNEHCLGRWKSYFEQTQTLSNPKLLTAFIPSFTTLRAVVWVTIRKLSPSKSMMFKDLQSSKVLGPNTIGFLRGRATLLLAFCSYLGLGII